MPRLSDEDMEARRREILFAAIRCFSRRGIHATTMRDIFGEAGMSAGAVYNYFRSKDDLIAGVVEMNLVNTESVQSSFAAEGLSPEGYRAMIKVFLDDLPAARDDGRARMAGMVVAHSSVDAALLAMVKAGRERIRRTAYDQIAQVRPDLDAETREVLVEFVFNLYQGMVQAVALDEDPRIDAMLGIIDHVHATFPPKRPG